MYRLFVFQLNYKLFVCSSCSNLADAEATLTVGPCVLHEDEHMCTFSSKLKTARDFVLNPIHQRVIPL